MALERLLALALASTCATAATHACPTDTAPRAPDTLLTVQVGAGAARPYDAAALAALPTATLTQRQQVSPASAGASSTHSVAWQGLLLRVLLVDAGFGRSDGPRSERLAMVEAVASDGWVARFSWGELFNHPLGDQVLVVLQRDGRALDAQAGPLALRSLSDLRPGPRHVRNLCALRIRPSG
jgi:hypothetical protein